MLLDIKTFIRQYYGSAGAPSVRQVRAWIARGKLPAEKRGRAYYVDTDRIKPATGNDLADKVLRSR